MDAATKDRLAAERQEARAAAERRKQQAADQQDQQKRANALKIMQQRQAISQPDSRAAETT